MTSAPIVAESAVKHVSQTTKGGASQPRVSAVPESALEVEAALVRALERASAAGQWEAVKLLADELRARRLALTSVVDLSRERARRR